MREIFDFVPRCKVLAFNRHSINKCPVHHLLIVLLFGYKYTKRIVGTQVCGPQTCVPTCFLTFNKEFALGLYWFLTRLWVHWWLSSWQSSRRGWRCRRGRCIILRYTRVETMRKWRGLSATRVGSVPPTGCSDALHGCFQRHFTFVPIGLYYGKVPSERTLRSILYCVTNASLQYSHLCFLGISSVGMYSRENRLFKEKY